LRGEAILCIIRLSLFGVVGFDAGNAKGGLLGGGGFSSPWLPGWGRSGGMRRREERERDPLGLPGPVEKKKSISFYSRRCTR